MSRRGKQPQKASPYSPESQTLQERLLSASGSSEPPASIKVSVSPSFTTCKMGPIRTCWRGDRVQYQHKIRMIFQPQLGCPHPLHGLSFPFLGDRVVFPRNLTNASHRTILLKDRETLPKRYESLNKTSSKKVESSPLAKGSKGNGTEKKLNPRGTTLLLDSNCLVTGKDEDDKEGKMLGKLGQTVPLPSPGSPMTTVVQGEGQAL